MALPREFIMPNASYGAESGTPDLSTVALRNSVPSAREELFVNIKIDKANILAAFPTLTMADLTKEFGLKFISGGLPLVMGPTNEYIFTEEAMLSPDKILENYNIGTSMNNNALLDNIDDSDGVSYYIKAQNSGKTRCVLLGTEAYFHMKVAPKNMEVADYTKGRNGDPAKMPTEAELNAPVTVTGDYAKYAGTPIRDQNIRLGNSVKFTYSTVEKAEGWVVVPSTDPTATCKVTAIDATVGANGSLIEAFGSVLVKNNK